MSFKLNKLNASIKQFRKQEAYDYFINSSEGGVADARSIPFGAHIPKKWLPNSNGKGIHWVSKHRSKKSASRAVLG
jgi:hypothetical protein